MSMKAFSSKLSGKGYSLVSAYKYSTYMFKVQQLKKGGKQVRGKKFVPNKKGHRNSVVT